MSGVADDLWESTSLSAPDDIAHPSIRDHGGSRPPTRTRNYSLMP